MAGTLTLYDLAPSPNNMKARIALGYKGLKYEKVSIMDDRSEVIKVSGQPLTPVLAHDGRVIFDSAAIARYLEANFRDTPRLFSSDYDTMHAIEDWELHAKNHLLPSVGTIFGQFFAEKKDGGAVERANKMLYDGSARIEEALAKGAWLLGESMTYADVACAPMVFYGMLPEAAAKANPIATFFASHFKLGAGRDGTRAWVMKVMAYDR